jgi:UDP-2,3-diacylglucosamine pyrophosphatase LpxH
VGDIHVPFQDKRAVAVVIDFLKWYRPDHLFLIGDIVDFYAISRYDKDPDRILGLQDEIDETVDLLATFRKAVGPTCRITYREGNHELRLQKYVRTRPEIAKLRGLQLPALLDFFRFNITHADYNQLLWHEGISVEHGDSVRKHAGYTACSMLERRGCSGISGHTHRLAMHCRSDNDDKMWIENGCLCRLDPDYVIGRPNWQHGFTVGRRAGPHGHYILQPLPIVDYKLIYHDRLFHA